MDMQTVLTVSIFLKEERKTDTPKENDTYRGMSQYKTGIVLSISKGLLFQIVKTT